jgi:hypothetical protein
MVAVGFNPRKGIAEERCRRATIEALERASTFHFVSLHCSGSIVAPRRRGFGPIDHRGLKPTATFNGRSATRHWTHLAADSNDFAGPKQCFGPNRRHCLTTEYSREAVAQHRNPQR